MELSELLSVARLAVMVSAGIGAAVLGVSGSLIGLIVRQSRVLGQLEQRLQGMDDLIEQLAGLSSRLESNERQVYEDTRGIAQLRRDVDRRCPEGAIFGGSLIPDG